jgi:hypothetical protein
MGGMTAETAGNWIDFSGIAKQFPKVSYRLLGAVGSRAAKDFYANYLQGQRGITYHSRNMLDGLPLDRQGRQMVSYHIAKSGKYVKVSSYPLNLFENGRKLRTKRGAPEKRQPGLGILRSFRSSIDPQKYAAAAFEYIMQDELKQAGV